jgi:hypothetical protein
MPDVGVSTIERNVGTSTIEQNVGVSTMRKRKTSQWDNKNVVPRETDGVRLFHVKHGLKKMLFHVKRILFERSAIRMNDSFEW